MRFALINFLVALPLTAQMLVNPVRNQRLAKSFETHETDKLLKCDIAPIKPMLNYGFRFQAGYVARIPLIQYFGTGNRLTVLSRITPKNGKPVYFAQGMSLPPIPDNAPNKKDQIIETGGNVLMGEGQYEVEFVLADNLGRVCRKKWTAVAELKGANRDIKAAIPSNAVTDLSLRGLPKSTAVDAKDEDARKLRLTVMVHATPMSPRRTQLRASDEAILLGTLSALLSRVPSVSVRLVVFNLEQHKEIFRREKFQFTDFEEVSDAIQKIDLGAVDYSVLKDRKGHLDLLANLINNEQTENPADAVVFLGPMARHLDKIPAESIEKQQGALPRFFYFRFESFFRRNPNAGLPDAISLALKNVKGKSIVIHTPAEFSKAIDQVINKTSRS